MHCSNLFIRSIGEGTDVIDKEMYTFITKGRDKVALRPEFTAGIARAYIQHGMNVLHKPVKLFSTGTAYRYDRPQEGRYREHRQANFDILGEQDPILDAQLIQLASRVIDGLGIKNICYLAESLNGRTMIDSKVGNGTTIIPPKRYAIIADHGTKIYENFSIPANTTRLYIDDSNIGNGLGNSEDKLILKNITGNFTDAVEWSYDYTDVPGMPTDLVDEGHSLARHSGLDTNNSTIDFYDGILPTPGSENQFIQGGNLDIALCQSHIPKIQNNSEFVS